MIFFLIAYKESILSQAEILRITALGPQIKTASKNHNDFHKGLK